MQKHNYITRMYLRAYAQTQRSSPEKSAADVSDSAGFKITMTLTAPLMALGVICAVIINRLHPGTFTKHSNSKFYFVAVLGAVTFAVFHLVIRRFNKLPIPDDIAQKYGTPAQVALRWIEILSGPTWLLFAGLVVGLINKG